jgi:CRP-like cAMP-binding protein
MSRSSRLLATAFFQYDDPSAVPRDEPFLATCTDEEWRSIAARSERRRFRAGEQIIATGDSDGALLIILDGEVSTSIGSGRRSRTLSVSPAGSVVGELGFLDGLPRSADVVATTDGELLRLSRADFDALAAAQPALGRLILSDLGRVVAMRVRRLTERLTGQ